MTDLLCPDCGKERFARGRCACGSFAKPAERAQDEFERRERPCSRCGTPFTMTARRRMLCANCFRTARAATTSDRGPPAA